MDADENTVEAIFTEISKEHLGKRVLMVSHNLRFRHIWKYLTGFVGDVMDETIKRKYGISNTEIIKLPLTPLINELDQWIYSELYNLIEKLDIELAGYRLDTATNLLS
jgi:broad specificity phosphatase PhoE